MKKLLLSLILMLACQWVSAQTADAVFSDYRSQKKAEYVSVPRAVMSIAAAKMKSGNVQALLQQVRSAKVLRLDGCKKSVRKKFAKKINALTSQGYEEYSHVKNDEHNVLILVKQDSNSVNEIVGLMNDRYKCTAVLITGDINREDIEAVVDMIDM